MAHLTVSDDERHVIPGSQLVMETLGVERVAPPAVHDERVEKPGAGTDDACFEQDAILAVVLLHVQKALLRRSPDLRPEHHLDGELGGALEGIDV